MNNSDRGGLFGNEAEQYDSTITLVDPYYKEMHEMLLKLAIASIGSSAMQQGPPVMALDIGSGTGAEAIPLLKHIPNLHFVGVDSSAAMHKVFRQRAEKANVPECRFRLIQADILDSSTQGKISSDAFDAFGGTQFTIITSAFTLHHFDTEQKAAVFRLVHDLLGPGGVFVMGDLFNYEGESSWLSKTTSAWETEWFAKNFDDEASKAQERGDTQSATALKALKNKWLRHYQEENSMDAVTSQLVQLKKAGFQEAGNPFRFWQVGLIFAKK